MDYQDFMTKAKKTPETSDDVFLKLMIDTYGEHGESYPNWFIMTWDYGGYTLLGKGSHLKKLQKINDALQKSPDFKEYITKVRESLFRDISQSNNFAVPKANVIKEINQILSDKSIDASEKTQLQNRIKQLNKPSKDFQFNCEKENCQYG